MTNLTQAARYQKLLRFLNENFTQDITPEMVESVCFYSYRNINRIFSATRGETIGHHIRRVRLEKAAAALQYSKYPVSEIAEQVGYADTASFSKAFKLVLGCSPTDFRQQSSIFKSLHDANLKQFSESDVLPHTVCNLPPCRVLYVEYSGSYNNIVAIQGIWEDLINFAYSHGLLHNETEHYAEVLDDDTITENIYCRYVAALTLTNDAVVPANKSYFVKALSGGKYARFTHTGSHETCDATYKQIFAQWIHHVDEELDDRAILERYDVDDTSEESQSKTDIFIPIVG